MGRNSKVVAQKPVSVPVVAPTAAAAVTTSSSTSSSASANSYQNLIRSLVSIPEGATDERTEILQKLASEYKNLVCGNKLNALKEKYLSEELAEIQAKYDSVLSEATKTKTEHDTLSSKYQKLRQLSQQLSDRTKQADSRATVALNEEQQKRVKLTEAFSASITAISTKLDNLTQRREVVVTENARLKATLKAYLDEFDGDQKQEEAQPAPANPVRVQASEIATEDSTAVHDADRDSSGPLQMETETADESTTAAAPVAETSAVLAMECSPPDVADSDTLAVDAPATEAPEEATVKVESSAEVTASANTKATEAAVRAASEEAALRAANSDTMAAEDDEARLAQLRATEATLRAKSAQYAQLFDSFQTKLAGCNEGFQSKQSSIEALSKEMVALEKDNAVTTKKVSDCAMSTKVMMNMHSKVLVEQQKQIKVLEKYQGLIDLLQKEIAQSTSK